MCRKDQIQVSFATLSIAAILQAMLGSPAALGQCQQAKLLASDGAHGDWLSWGGAAVDGETIVLGSLFHADGAGAAYVYYRNHGGVDSWGELKKLTALDGQQGDGFGTVTVSADTIAVGAQADDGGRGAVYIFYRNYGGPDNWGEFTKLAASDANWSDYFGVSVCADGDTVVVGAPFDDENGGDSGAVYIFCRNEGGPDNWGEVKKITASDAGVEDWFGFPVSIDGDTVVAGAWPKDDGQGAAYIYSRNHGGADNWGEVKKLTASNAGSFGWSVSVDGDTVVVGAPDEGTSTDSGAAYVYYRDHGGADNWGEVKKLTASDAEVDDHFGVTSLDGDVIVVGATGTDPGGVYVFYRDEGGLDNWGEVAKIVHPDGWPHSIGDGVSVSGDIVVIGDPYADDNGSGSGAAYVFDHTGSAVGDVNCDCAIDLFDIDPFVLAMTNPPLYANVYPNCDYLSADCNDDGFVDLFDIDAFVDLLTR